MLLESSYFAVVQFSSSLSYDWFILRTLRDMKMNNQELILDDLNKLIDFLALISKQPITYDPIKVLLELSPLCDQLARNNDESQLIRNRYGRYDWSKNKQKNPAGLDFDCLRCIHVIIDDGDKNSLIQALNASQHYAVTINIYMLKIIDIVEEKLKELNAAPSLEGGLKVKLSATNTKLQQMGFANIKKYYIDAQPAKNNDVLQSTENLECFIDTHHSLLLCQHINEKVLAYSTTHQQSLNGMTKLDRYAVASLLTTVGESFKQFPKYLQSQDLSSAMNLIADIRDKFAHEHHKFIRNPDDTLNLNLSPSIQNFIVLLESTLHLFTRQLREASAHNPFVVPNQLTWAPDEEVCLQEFAKSCDVLYQVIAPKTKVTAAVKVQQPKSKEKIAKVKSKEDYAKLIAGITIKLQKCEEKITILSRADDDGTKQALLVDNIGDNKKYTTVEAFKKEVIQDKNNLSTVLEREKTEMQKHYAALPSNAELQLLIDELSGRTQQQPKPRLLRTEKLLNEIFEEGEFLKEIIITQPHLKLVIEHSNNVIGQLYRDLKQEADPRLDDLVTEDTAQSMAASISTRNKYSHELITARKIPLHDILMHDSLPAIPEVSAINRLLKSKSEQNENVPVTTAALLVRALAFTTLGKMPEAIQCYQDIINQEERTPQALYFLLNMRNLLASAWDTKAQQHMRNEQHAEYHRCFIYKRAQLAKVLVATDLMYSGKNIEIILASIDEDYDINQLLAKTFRSTPEIASLINNIALSYAYVGDESRALPLYKRARKIALLLKDPAKEAIYLTNLSVLHLEKAIKRFEHIILPGDVIGENVEAIKATAFLWRAKDLLSLNKNEHEQFYLRVVTRLAKAMQVLGMPNLLMLSLHFLEEVQAQIGKQFLRRNHPVMLEYHNAYSMNTEIMARLSAEQKTAMGSIDKLQVYLELKLLPYLIEFYEGTDTANELTQRLRAMGNSRERLESVDGISSVISEISKLQDKGAFLFAKKKYTTALKCYQQSLYLSVQTEPDVRTRVEKRALTDITNTCIQMEDFKLANIYLIQLAEWARQHGIDDEIAHQLRQWLLRCNTDRKKQLKLMDEIDAANPKGEYRLTDYFRLLEVYASVCLAEGKMILKSLAIMTRVSIFLQDKRPEDLDERIMLVDLFMTRIHEELIKSVCQDKTPLAIDMQRESYNQLLAILDRYITWPLPFTCHISRCLCYANLIRLDAASASNASADYRSKFTEAIKILNSTSLQRQLFSSIQELETVFHEAGLHQQSLPLSQLLLSLAEKFGTANDITDFNFLIADNFFKLKLFAKAKMHFEKCNIELLDPQLKAVLPVALRGCQLELARRPNLLSSRQQSTGVSDNDDNDDNDAAPKIDVAQQNNATYK